MAAKTKINLYTKPEVYQDHPDSEPLPYDRVVAASDASQHVGWHIGSKDLSEVDKTAITVDNSRISDLSKALQHTLNRQRATNCHRFGRMVLGLDPTERDITTDYLAFPMKNKIDDGSTAIVGVEGFGVPHTIGYGMGDRALQVLSSGGELGIVGNSDLISYYENLYPSRNVGIYQLPPDITPNSAGSDPTLLWVS